MPVLEQLNVGLVGALGRGGAFAAALTACGACVHAVCDVRADRLDECMARLGAAEKYADYEQMLDQSELDAVVIATPMPRHVPQSIAALARGLHVLCEVPAGVSVDECKDLVLTAGKSGGLFMLAENYTYLKHNVVIRELVRAGLFGEAYYAEGEYLHELKELNEATPWRRTWQTGIDGITYGTHSLGPILQWLAGDRVARVCCEGAGRRHRDPRRELYHQDCPVMLGKTARGGLIKIRVDMTSDRPHAMTNYQLQGTDGAYESSRGGPGDGHRIWLRQLSKEPRWFDLEALWATDDFAAKYLPEELRNPPAEARRAGHGGGDFFVVRDFVRAVRREAVCPVGIHEAMDMTLPGLVSQQSIAQGGAWLAVPDSRQWNGVPPYRQLQMVWPQKRLKDAPPVRVPAGYALRQFAPGDEAAYMELMHAVQLGGRWDHERVAQVAGAVLPEGFFVIVHEASGKLVATALAQHHPSELHPFGGEMGWVAADPAHQGRGLGRAVTAAAVGRLIRAGYRRIYLQTDDYRLPAIKVYLQVGFEPLVYAPDMEKRWGMVLTELGWK